MDAQWTAGVDEAGRGCLAGPVYAAAVILDTPIPGLRDSKQLGPARRERLFDLIHAQARCVAIATADVEEIDRLNILRASLLAMRRAVDALALSPARALVDGNQCPGLRCASTLVVGGDALHPEIMAASILAKVARDRALCALDAQYPGYGLARHKGYGTPDHLAALHRLGPSPVHRMSFAPCAQSRLLAGCTPQAVA